MAFGHSVTYVQQHWQAGHSGRRYGGREQESNLPGAAEQPQPALKAGRPTGTASLPSRIIGALRQLGNEGGFVGRFQTAAIQPQPAIGQPADHRARQAAQPDRQRIQSIAVDRNCE